MHIQFDPAKDLINQSKHGVSLEMAEQLEWDWLVCHEDESRHDYYELRLIGFAPIGPVVYCLVFVEIEDDILRIISLRKATKPEVKDYASQI